MLRFVLPVCTLLICVLRTSLAAQGNRELPDTVTRALRWYFHWQKPFPRAKRLGCKGQNFDENYFVFCDPGGETLDLAKGKAGEFIVNIIASTTEDFGTQLRLFSVHQNRPVSGSFLFPVSSTDLAAYNIDPHTSKDLMDATVGSMTEAIRVYGQSGHHVRCLFPLVSGGDPFYEVYLAEGDRVEAVWLFPVADGKIQDRSRWVYDLPHHDIPESAQANLNDPLRWYASLPAPAIN
jgi:hypothetical protein